MRESHPFSGVAGNSLVVVGIVLLVGLSLAGLLVRNPLPARAVQLALPAVLAVGIVGYGLRHSDAIREGPQRIVGQFVLATFAYFIVVGGWFSVLAATFQTSTVLAMATSVVTGVALGAVIGVYALRLHAANTELERANAELNAFASILSHDLRNPLQVAAGSLELLADDADADPNVERIERAHDRIDTIIENVLVLTQGTGTIEDVHPVDVADVANDAWGTTDTEAATLRVDDPPTVDADADLLATLLENCFRNSVEHGSTGNRTQSGDSVEHGSTNDQSRTDGGDESGPVTVTVGRLEDSEGFYVADDGPGIPESEREDVFEFGESGSGGTGIGLFTVGRVADVHDWTYAVKDAENGGARFEFRT